jgi:hypothetical protein
MKAGTVVTGAKRRKETAPAIAQQQRERRGQRADGGLREVNRARGVSRVADAAASHEVQRKPKRRWKPASHLPALPNPPGYHVKWVRRDGRERGDCRGLAKYLSEQWEFAAKSDFPKHALPTQPLTGYGEVIGNGDMILMKLDEEMFAQRREYYETRRDTATYAVEKGSLDETSTIMPAQRPRRSSRTEFVRFRKRRPDSVEVAQDDDE